MSFDRPNRRMVLSGAAAGVFTGLVGASFARESDGLPQGRAFADLGALYHACAPGDLIFIASTTGLWTELAAIYSVGDRRWGHVGIVVEATPGVDPIVVHADGSPLARDGGVERQDMTGFLGKAEQAGLFRPGFSPEERNAALAYAASAADRGVPFDGDFSLRTPDRLYCSELIWLYLSAGLGEDAVPLKQSWIGRPFIALSDLSLHPKVQELGVWTAPGVALSAKD